MTKYFLAVSLIFLYSCTEQKAVEPVIEEIIKSEAPKTNVTSLVILGTIQDAGAPHIACKKACCADLFENPDKDKQVIF